MKGVKIPALGNTLISLMIDYSSLWQIQTEAARIATGTTKLVSIENLNSEIGWDTLDARRKQKQNLTLFYKMAHNLTPNYLTSLIPSTVNEKSNYISERLLPLLNISSINLVLPYQNFIMSESDKLKYYTPVSGLNVTLFIITYFSEI